MNTPLTPIFLFSLPRAGSTLLQRVVGAHRDVATVTEPHILMPLLYAFRRSGVVGEYDHGNLVDAFEDLCQELPGGRADFDSELHDFVLRIYGRTVTGTPRYFLDKTPRYHTVVYDIVRIFPEAKIIFLWRNPLAIAASIIDSFGDGRWNLIAYRLDLYQGIDSLVEACQQHADRACVVRYEDLIEEPEVAVRKLQTYLDIELDESVIARFTEVELPGRPTDRMGMNAYKQLSGEPLLKWRRTLNNPLRKRWARNYLKFIGPERLEFMGYNYDTLRAELDSAPTNYRKVGADMRSMTRGYLSSLLNLRMAQHNFKLLRTPHRIHRFW